MEPRIDSWNLEKRICIKLLSLLKQSLSIIFFVTKKLSVLHNNTQPIPAVLNENFGCILLIRQRLVSKLRAIEETINNLSEMIYLRHAKKIRENWKSFAIKEIIMKTLHCGIIECKERLKLMVCGSYTTGLRLGTMKHVFSWATQKRYDLWATKIYRELFKLR